MFGKNEVASVMWNDDGKLLVHSVFYTIQGEGPDAGRPAVFVRLAKCNLRCHFCDTDFEKGVERTSDELVDEVLAALELKQPGDELCVRRRDDLVVITGGEPLLQNIGPFVRALNNMDIDVSVETAGTVWHESFEESFDPIYTNNKLVCSPKTPILATGIHDSIMAYKYIVRHWETCATDGLPIMSTQLRDTKARVARPHHAMSLVYVQPMDEGDKEKNELNMQAAAAVAMRFGYILSIQVHKIVGLP